MHGDQESNNWDTYCNCRSCAGHSLPVAFPPVLHPTAQPAAPAAAAGCGAAGSARCPSTPAPLQAHSLTANQSWHLRGAPHPARTGCFPPAATAANLPLEALPPGPAPESSAAAGAVGSPAGVAWRQEEQGERQEVHAACIRQCAAASQRVCRQKHHPLLHRRSYTHPSTIKPVRLPPTRHPPTWWYSCLTSPPCMLCAGAPPPEASPGAPDPPQPAQGAGAGQAVCIDNGS